MVLVLHSLDGSGTKVKEIYAVCNPTLLADFSSQSAALAERAKNTDLFFSKKWLSAPEAKKREWVADFLNQKIKAWPWNSEKSIAILPAIHGTTSKDAWGITRAGFGEESEGNTGFYGKGFYFTSSAAYSAPYVPPISF